MKAVSVFWIFSTTFILAVSATAIPCIDEVDSSDCALWKSYCASETTFSVDYLQKNCRKTCGICDAPPTDKPKPPTRVTVAPPCRDEVGTTDCVSWKSYCELGSAFIGYMQKNCKKTCGICGTSPTDAPKPTTPKRTIQIYPKGCGRDKTFFSFMDFIGFEAFPNSWIWQGGMYLNGEFACGGALIAKNLFLTAAHCTDGSTEGITIRMGDHNRTENENTEQERSVESIKVHTGYSIVGRINDIALVKIDGNFTLNDNVGIVCLPEENEETPDAKKILCYITGWVRTDWDEPRLDVLQEFRVPPVPNAVCGKRMINPVTGESKINDTMLCAGFEHNNGNKGLPCRLGDSGGPYVCKQKGQGQKWVLHGIVSRESSTCENSQYTIFTRVSKFIKWIKEAASTI